jgi:ribose 5-phosphate isomerase B
VIFLGADHRGFALKEKVKDWLGEWGLSFEDLGAHRLDPDDDYVDFAAAVAARVARGEGKGILICGSGHGMSIAANKFPGVRSTLVWDVDGARQGRKDEDANVLSLPADSLDPGEAKKIVKVWLETKPSFKERYRKRREKLEKLEKEL